MTPLVVITLFLSLTEAVLGAITWGLSGKLQFAFAIFFMAMMALIVLLFFATLWFRNYKLFPPREFENIDPVQYVTAMQMSGESFQLNGRGIAQQIGSIVASNEARELVLTALQSTDDDSTLTERVDRALGELADAAIDRLILTLDATVVLGNSGSVWSLVYEPTMPVFQLLNEVWTRSQPQLTLFSYDTTWFLSDRTSRRAFRDLGTLWALKNHRPTDDRTIESVGIRSGMHLQVTLLPTE